MRDIIKTETNQEAISRRQKMDITLERYHGLGNDYLVYDPNEK